MKTVWFSSIPRLFAICFVIFLYGMAAFSVFRKTKKNKPSSFPGFGKDLNDSMSGSDSLRSYPGPERRIYPRVKFDTYIRYKLCRSKCGFTTFKEGCAVDISEGGVGLLLETSEKMSVDDKLEMKLKLSVVSGYILIRGTIVWTKELEEDKWYRYGISFTEIDPNDKKLIAKFVVENKDKMV